MLCVAPHVVVSMKDLTVCASLSSAGCSACSSLISPRGRVGVLHGVTLRGWLERNEWSVHPSPAWGCAGRGLASLRPIPPSLAWFASDSIYRGAGSCNDGGGLLLVVIGSLWLSLGVSGARGGGSAVRVEVFVSGARSTGCRLVTLVAWAAGWLGLGAPC